MVLVCEITENSFFFISLTKLTSNNVVDIMFFFHIMQKRGKRMYAARVGSALKISASKLPFLGTLSYFKLLIAVTISNFDGLSALISKSVFSSGT